MAEQDSPEQVREMQRIGAVARLAFARKTHPELGRAEASARVDLAAAIMAMDEAEDADEHGIHRHNMQEQAAVEVAIRAYANALASLVRGEAPEPTPAPVLMPIEELPVVASPEAQQALLDMVDARGRALPDDAFAGIEPIIAANPSDGRVYPTEVVVDHRQ